MQDALARKATAELPATPASSGKSKTGSTVEKSPKKKKSTVEKSPKKKSTVEKSPKKKKSPKKSPKKSSPKKKGSPTKSGATSTPPAPAPKKAAPTSSDSSDSEEDAEDEDEGSDTELPLAQLRAKKAAHARYMRFSRSLKSRRAEPQPANMISPQSWLMVYLVLLYYIKYIVLRMHHITHGRFDFTCDIRFFISIKWYESTKDILYTWDFTTKKKTNDPKPVHTYIIIYIHFIQSSICLAGLFF